MEGVLQELKQMEVAFNKIMEWAWTVAVILAVINKVVEVGITKYMLEI